MEFPLSRTSALTWLVVTCCATSASDAEFSDTAPARPQSVQRFAIPEDAPPGTVLGTIESPLGTGYAKLRYRLATGSEHVLLDANSGLLRLAPGASLDFETSPRYALQVAVTGTPTDNDPVRSAFAEQLRDIGADRGSVSRLLDRTEVMQIYLDVQNVNEAPQLAPATFQIAENAPAGTLLGTISAKDADFGDVLAFSIVSGDDGRTFAFESGSGRLTVARPASLDYEHTPRYDLTVEAVDSSGARATAGVTVLVGNLNESPLFDAQNFRIEHDAPPGTFIGNVQARDRDSGDQLTYSIVGGNSAGAFTLESQTGTLTLANPAALAGGPHELIVQTTDAAGNSRVAPVRVDVDGAVLAAAAAVPPGKTPTTAVRVPRPRSPGIAEDPVARQGLLVVSLMTVLMFFSGALWVRRSRTRETRSVLKELVQEFERLQQEVFQLAGLREACETLQADRQQLADDVQQLRTDLTLLAQHFDSSSSELDEASAALDDKDDQDLLQITRTVEELRGDLQSLRHAIAERELRQVPLAPSSSHDTADDEPLNHTHQVDGLSARTPEHRGRPASERDIRVTNADDFHSPLGKPQRVNGTGVEVTEAVSGLRTSLADMFGLSLSDTAHFERVDVAPAEESHEQPTAIATATHDEPDSCDAAEEPQAVADIVLKTAVLTQPEADRAATARPVTARPQPPAAPTPAVSEAKKSDEVAESVEEFMQRLLERNNLNRAEPVAAAASGRLSPTPSPLEPAASPQFAMNAEPAETINEADTVDLVVTVSEPPAPVAQLDKEAVRAGLDSMRELANHSARKAVHTYAWRKNRRRLIMLGALALTSFGLAGVAAYVGASRHIPSLSRGGEWAVIVGVITLVYTGYRYFASRRAAEG